MEIQVHVRLAVQLADLQVEIFFFLNIYRISSNMCYAGGKMSVLMSRVCREKRAGQGKTVKQCTTTYCWNCDVVLGIGHCFQVYCTKLNYWEWKWQLIFRGSAAKNHISVQCVNCGCIVTGNVIPASEFTFVVWTPNTYKYFILFFVHEIPKHFCCGV